MKQKVYFQNMDVIRFFAALLIFIGHGFQAWEGYFAKGRMENWGVLKTFLINNTGLGVELFFLISGFLITYILLVEKENAGKIAIGKFFMRRAIRIWPLYFLLIAITPFLINWMGINEPHYFSNLFFVGNYDNIVHHGGHYPFSHFWSIAVEEQFYVIWPFVIAFIPRKRLIYLFIILILTSVAMRYYYFKHSNNAYYHFYYNTICRMDTIVIGAVIALYYERIKTYFAFNKTIIFILLLGLCYILFFTSSNNWWTLSDALFKKYLYLLFFIPITMFFITKKQSGINGKFNRILSYLGKSSYGLYMIHNMVILVIIKRIIFNNDLGAYGWLFWVIYVAITFILVIISFEFFEKPLLKLKRLFTVIKTREF